MSKRHRFEPNPYWPRRCEHMDEDGEICGLARLVDEHDVNERPATPADDPDHLNPAAADDPDWLNPEKGGNRASNDDW